MAASIRVFRSFFLSRHCLRLHDKVGFKTHHERSPMFRIERLISSSRVKSQIDSNNVKKRMETLTDKFSEARELLNDARESMGTVYFSEDMEEAQQAVNETLEEYRTFLDSLTEKQRQDVISTIGLRMEELKAQKAAIEETLKD